MLGTTLHISFQSGAAAHAAGIPGVQDVGGVAYTVVSTQTTRSNGESTMVVVDVTNGGLVWHDPNLHPDVVRVAIALAGTAHGLMDVQHGPVNL